MRKPTRDYMKIVNAYLNMNMPFQVSIIGFVQYYDTIYPILKLENCIKGRKFDITMQTGVHGDEAIGVRVVMNFLKDFKTKWLNYYNFTIFPCVNPYGYSFNVRKNGNKQIISRFEFWNNKNIDVPELQILGKHYPERPDIFIDVHGDTGKSKWYMYERRPINKESIAKLSLKENKKIAPFIQNATIYREICEDGVIVNPEHDKSIDDGMEFLGVPYVMVLEIPIKMDARLQIEGGVKILNSILKNHLKIMLESKFNLFKKKEEKVNG